MASSKWEILFASVLILVFASFFRLFGMDYAVYSLVFVVLWAYLAQCWNICYGYAGLLSFGHVAFFGLGAYTATLLFLSYGLTPWLGMLAGGGVAVLLSLIVGIPTIKLRGAYFALATIAIAEMVRLLVLKLDFITNGALGLLLPPHMTPLQFYFKDVFHWFLISFGMLVALLIISYKLERSSLGMAFRAIKDNETAAASLGIYPFKFKVTALAISAFLTSLGGVFYAQYLGYIRPDIVLAPVLSDEILIVCILGGAGSLMGPVVGSLIFITLRNLFLAYFGGGSIGTYLLLYGALIVTIILFLPEGIYPNIRKLLVKYTRLKT